MRKILVVVDMQNDFIDGSLGTAEACAIVDRVKEKILSYPEENRFATLDTHGEDYMETQEGWNLPVPHCIKGSDGWKLRADYEDLIPQENRFEKPTFGSVKLAAFLQNLAQKEEIAVEFVGLCTDICVVSNVLMVKAFLPEVTVTVDSACCAGVTPMKHEAALETMRSCQVSVI